MTSMVPVVLCLGLAAAPAAASTRMASPLTAAETSAEGPVTPLALDATALETLRQAERFTFTGFPLDAVNTVDLELRRFDILAEDARSIVHTDDGDVQVEPPNVVLLRGSVAGRPGSRVFLSLSPHGANGFIRTGGEQFIVAGARPGADRPTVIYSLDRLPAGALEVSPFECGADDLPPVGLLEAAPPAGGSVALAGPTQCSVDVQVAVETDWEFTESFGGSTFASGAYALTLMGAVSEIYHTEDPEDLDVGVGMSVSHLSLWETENDPWDAATTQNQLLQFKDYWEANMDAVDRNVAHFLSTRVLGGASGTAFLPGVCQGEWAYGITTRVEGDFPYPLEFDGHEQNYDLVVVAHELGHNFGAPHTHALDPPIDECAFGVCEVDPDTQMIEGTIMSYCHQCDDDVANINLVFHERMLNEWIHPYITLGLPCVLGSETPTITGQPESLAVCEGDPAFFVVSTSSSVPVTYQWRHNGSDIADAVNPAYAIGAVGPADFGNYDVVVSTDCASIESDVAVLSLDPTCEPPPPDPCPADLDGDDNVGINDFLALLAAWDTDPGGPPDYDADGNVGISDFLFLLANWGPC